MDAQPRTRHYAVTEKAIQQRQVNAHSRQFSNFIKTLQGKLRLHLDEVARLQEVTTMIKHCFSFEQISQLYQDELQEYVNQACSERLADMQAKLLSAQQVMQKLAEKRMAHSKLLDTVKVSEGERINGVGALPPSPRSMTAASHQGSTHLTKACRRSAL